MSPTLDELVRRDELAAWHPDVGPRRHHKRRLFVTRDYATWMDTLASDPAWTALLPPKVELSTIAADFVAGERMMSFIRGINPPKGEGLLRINTSNFRLVGWCPEPQCIALLIGASVTDTHGPGNKLTKLGQEAVKIRRRLGVTDWAKGELYELFRYQD